MISRKRKRFILEHKRKIKLAKSLFLAGITASAVGLQAPAEVYANTDEAGGLTSTVVIDNTNVEEIKDATKGSIEISVETDNNSEIEESEGLRTETDTGLENVSTVTTDENKSISVTLNNESNDETESTFTSEPIDTEKTQLDEEKLVDTSTELNIEDNDIAKENYAAKISISGNLNSFLGHNISRGILGNNNKDVSVLGDYSYSGCVQWVKDRAVTLLGIRLPNTGLNKYGLGGANGYWTRLPQAGYATGQEPAKNAIAVWEHNPYPVYGSRNYGHVAFVENVNGDTVTISQGGVSGNWNGHTGVSYRNYHKSQVAGIAGKFLGYVYLRERPAPAAPPVNRLDVWNIAQSVRQRVTGGDYRIVSNANPSLLVSVQDGSTNSGANIRLEQDRNVENQVFTITHHDEGFYRIIHKASGNAVDAEGDVNGNNIASHGFHGRNNQQWIIRPTGDGYTYEIIDRRSGLVMDIAGGRIENGTNIQLWESNGTGAQKFRLVAVDSDARKTISDGTYRILSKFNEQMGLSEAASGDSSHSNAQINTSSGNQQFDVKYLGNGYYSITSKVTGRKLDVYGDKSYMGSNVVFHTANASDAQQWIIKEAGNGYYEIIAKKKNMYLDTDGSQNFALEGGNVQIWRSSGSVNQLWKFVAIPERPAVVAGWKKDSKGWWYQNEDGSYPKNDWKFVDKKWYYFDNSGYMLTGWQTIKGESYYLQPDGRMSASQWIKHLNNWYYVDKSGKRVKETWVGDYYLKSDSKMATSQWIQTGGTWYYVDETGKKVTNTWIDGYYLKPDSKMATSQWVQTAGVWYYVDKTGKRVANTWIDGYYLKSDSTMATSQWVQTNGIWYYVDKAGKKVTNTWIDGYYLKSDSKMATSQWIQTAGTWYYVDKTGKKVKNTWIDDYYLKSDGQMAQNEWINGIYVDSSGKRTRRP